MGKRKREPMSEGKRNIIAGLLQEYDIKTAKDIEDIYGFEVSDGMVSDITDRLLPQIEAWCKGYSCDMCRRTYRNERSSSSCISADRITALYCSSGEKYTEICRRKKEGICK